MVGVPPQMKGEGVEAEYEVDLTSSSTINSRESLIIGERTLRNHPATSTAAANPLSSFQINCAASFRNASSSPSNNVPPLSMTSLWASELATL